MRTISVFVLSWLTGCTCHTQAHPAGHGPDVVVVLVDTLRADAIGHHTPAIEELAAHGTTFTHAITPAAWTIPAVATLMTGLWPDTHRTLRFRGEDRVALDVLGTPLTTLAEAFHDAGWHTVARLKSPVITATHGFAQGFDDFELVEGETASGQSARQLTDAALRVLASPTDRPRFLWLHYMDPHTPYQPPKRLAAQASLGIDSRFEGSHAEVMAFKAPNTPPSPADVQMAKALYAAEVQYLDFELRRLFAALKESDRPTLIALIADHGEQLGEHGGWLHEDLWQENIAVPWILEGPGVETGLKVEPPVSTVHFAPTLLDLAGVSALPDAQGRSLRDLVTQDGLANLPVMSSYGARRVWITGAWKLLVGPTDADPATRALYNLQIDPSEQHDVASEQPDVLEALTQDLDATREQARRFGHQLQGRVEVEQLPDVQREALERLGYLTHESH